MGNKGGFVPVSWSVPDGWIFLGAVYRDVAQANTLASGVWYKKATSSEPANYNLSVNVAGSPVSTKRFNMAVVCVQNPGTLVGGSDIRFEPQSACRVFNTFTQGLVVGTWGPMIWTDKSYDHGNNFSLANRWYRVPAGGPYKYGLQMNTLNGLAGETFQAAVALSTNGGSSFSELSATGPVVAAGASARLTCEDSTYLNEGDLLRIDVIQFTGSARVIEGGGSARCFFYVKRDIST